MLYFQKADSSMISIMTRPEPNSRTCILLVKSSILALKPLRKEHKHKYIQIQIYIEKKNTIQIYNSIQYKYKIEIQEIQI